jgi:hypothetical protein
VIARANLIRSEIQSVQRAGHITGENAYQAANRPSIALTPLAALRASRPVRVAMAASVVGLAVMLSRCWV